jgi:hypothetical protein
MRSVGARGSKTCVAIVVVWWWCAPGTADLMGGPMKCDWNG